MNPLPNSYRKVRGGFSLFPSGQDQGVSGLGDECTDPSCMMTGPFVSLANPELQVDSSTPSLASIPTSAWLFLGIAVFSLWAYNKGR